MGAFMAELAQQEGVAALALRFAILTAARTGEVIGARRPEIDMQQAIWTIPGGRMKAGREHRVPLSDAALDVLREVSRLNTSEVFVFPGMKPGSMLFNTALLLTLRRMKRDDLTVHGFRSTFRDWVAETGKPADLAEAALAHTVGDKTIQAYLRGDLFERRRKLTADWAEYCGRAPDDSGRLVQFRLRLA
jgi:integrase